MDHTIKNRNPPASAGGTRRKEMADVLSEQRFKQGSSKSMTDQMPPEAATRSDRRSLLRGLGLGVAGATAATALGTAGLISSTQPAQAAYSDYNIFNFALNLEYLEAEFYIRAVSGQGLPSSLTAGAPSNTVNGGSRVPFQTTAIAYAAQQIANDEIAHVRFIQEVLGNRAVPEPSIDLVGSFTTLAIAAGLITAGQTFNPFLNESDFLLGAYIFEDVGVTAYAGAAPLLSAANLPYAAGILATEAYHAGMIRSRLAEIGLEDATNQISAVRQALGTVPDHGVNYNGNPNSFTNVDINGQPYTRKFSQVLSIVYGGGTSSGLFFPYGMNGVISTVST